MRVLHTYACKGHLRIPLSGTRFSIFSGSSFIVEIVPILWTSWCYCIVGSGFYLGYWWIVQLSCGLLTFWPGERDFIAFCNLNGWKILIVYLSLLVVHYLYSYTPDCSVFAWCLSNGCVTGWPILVRVCVLWFFSESWELDHDDIVQNLFISFRETPIWSLYGACWFFDKILSSLDDSAALSISLQKDLQLFCLEVLMVSLYSFPGFSKGFPVWIYFDPNRSYWCCSAVAANPSQSLRLRLRMYDSALLTGTEILNSIRLWSDIKSAVATLQPFVQFVQSLEHRVMSIMQRSLPLPPLILRV